MNTLAKLYLGDEPSKVTVRDDRLIITLANGEPIELPLQVVSQLYQQQPLLAEAQALILRQPPQVDHVHVTDRALNVYLQDGRMLSSPLTWFPRLLHGTPAERNYYELSGDNDVIHWPDLDEDIEVVRLLEGGKSLEGAQSIQRWLNSRHSHPITKMAAD